MNTSRKTGLGIPRDVLQKWDELNLAIGAMQLATPAHMSEASKRLELKRSAFESALRDAALAGGVFEK